VPGHRHSFVLLLLLIISIPCAAAPKQLNVADTRVLIDISGSMKKNDPQNRRRPALRLLVGLLPTDSRAGVWTFGQYVNMQVPLGKVDRAWKARAMKGADKIHSRGLFTNIEEAIKRATADWEGASTRYRRHLVLLTDGVVDVSKDPAESAASRRRILQQWLPRLKKFGAKVYTIALSERADHELMQALSRESGGWYEQVEDAARLQRVFLRIFEKVGQPDSVPLKDNRFRIDGSIDEATLLVFRQEDAQATRVTTPDGRSFGAADAPANVSWHRDAGYDLLTISKPMTGEWRIQATLDPDNRVMVVTDLKMPVDELPNRWVMGERMPLVARFTDGGRPMIDQGFLEVVNLQAEPGDTNGPGELRPLLDDGQDGDAQAGDGRFTLLLGPDLAAGPAEVTITAEGKTFQRTRHLTFEQLLPAILRVEPESSSAGASLLVRLSPAAEVLDVGSIEVTGRLVSTTGEEQPLMLLPATESQGWQGRIEPARFHGEWRVAVHLAARTRAGNPLSLDLEPVAFQGSGQAPPVEPPEPLAEKPPEQIPVADAEETDWMMLAGLFGALNLLLLLVAGGVFWLLRRRSARDRVQLLDDEEAGDETVDQESREALDDAA